MKNSSSFPFRSPRSHKRQGLCWHEEETRLLEKRTDNPGQVHMPLSRPSPPPPVLSPLIHVCEDCLGQRVGGRGRQAGWGRGGGGGAPRQLEEVTDKTAAAAPARCGPACAQPLREVDRSSVTRTQGARTLARFVYLQVCVCVQALSVQVKQFSERISRREGKRERKTISTYSRDGPENTSLGASTEIISSKAAAAGKKRAFRSYLNPFLTVFL